MFLQNGTFESAPVETDFEQEKVATERMEATREIQQIEQLLLSAQRPELPKDGHTRRYREIARELSTLISDPRIFRYENLLMLPRRLEEESILIFDAFESVTNGMYDPEILRRLQSVKDDSAFAPWKYAILALLSFYQADRDNMLQLIGKIPRDTPPALIGEALLFLTGIRTPEEPGGAVKKLLDLVGEDRTFIKSAVRQIEEYLETDLGDAFVETSILLLRELLPAHQEAARRLALWSIRTAADWDFDLSTYPSQLSALFGKSDGMRLTALALADTDPHLSILFWLRYAVSRTVENPAEESQISAVLSILADLCRTMKQDDFFHQFRADETYTRSLLSLIRKFQDELPGPARSGSSRSFPEDLFREREDPFRWLELVLSLYGEGENGAVEAENPLTKKKDTPSAASVSAQAQKAYEAQDTPRRTLKAGGKEAKQLELFDL